MANAGCINAIGFDGTYLRTLDTLDSANIGVGVQYCIPAPLDDKRLDYIKYTDKCGCTCCITGENEILVYATNGVIKNFTLTNDDTNEVVNVKRTDLFGSNRAYTMVRYKTGSYPTSITDGTLAVKETTQNQYSVSGYNVSGLTDGTTYYFTAFAVSQDGTIIVVQNKSITPSYGYVVNTDTLFYIKNDGESSDYSQFNHTMSWYGNSQYTTLSTGRKVAKFDGSNLLHSATYHEGDSYTTFTMHGRVRNLQVSNSDTSPFGRMGRNQNSSSTTDRWGAKWQTEPATTSNWYIIYGGGTTDRIKNTNVGYVPSSSVFDLMSFTVNGKTVKLYKNAMLIGSWTGTVNIKGGTSTGPTLFMGGAYAYSGDSSVGAFQKFELGELVFERKVQSDADIQTYYDKVRKRYRPQLQMYRPLISNATDQSTYSRNGTVNGTVSWNNGAVFSGSGNISSGMNDMPPSFTISCRVKKPSSSTSEQVLFAKWTPAGGSVNSLQRFGMHFNGSNMLKVYQGVSTSSHNWVDVMTFNTSDWYNVVYTYKNGTVKVYVDAVLKNNFSSTFNNSTSNSMNIGGWSSSQSNLTGTMREFTIEEGERSQSDVSAYFQSTKSTFGK